MKALVQNNTYIDTSNSDALPLHLSSHCFVFVLLSDLRVILEGKQGFF